MDQLENLMSKPFCVYAHVDGDTIFYVGCGYVQRAFEFKRDRKQEHKNRMNSCDFTVKIFARFSCRQETLDFERSMISVLQPECNMQLSRMEEKLIRRDQSAEIRKERYRQKRIAHREANPRIRKPKKERPKGEYKNIYPIQCVETGTYYYGATHAGREMQISQARVSATLLGKCSSADGYHFVRATWEESCLDRAAIHKPHLQKSRTTD